MGRRRTSWCDRDSEHRRAGGGLCAGWGAPLMSLLSSARAAWTRHGVARRAAAYVDRWSVGLPMEPAAPATNDLLQYCAHKRSGRGLWKWEHYLEIYDRHFARFRGHAVHVMEIGVYSGGSLEMW